jgi:hypothetical protein
MTGGGQVVGEFLQVHLSPAPGRVIAMDNVKNAHHIVCLCTEGILSKAAG